MKKVTFGVVVGAVLAASLLTGCDSSAEKRRKICVPAILDANQAFRGDDRIDMKAVRKVIDANACTYQDIRPEDEQERAEELRKNPIPIKRKELKQDGVDWSKPSNYRPKNNGDSK